MSWLWAMGTIPAWATSPTVGLRPTIALLPAGQTIDPSVSVADRDRAQVRRGRDRRPGARATGIPRQVVRVAGETAPCAPAVEKEAGLGDRLGDEAAEVGPFRQVGLAEHHGPGRPQAGHDRGVARHPAADERERARRRLHRVVGRDVVLEQDRDPVQRTAAPAGPSLGITPGGDRQGVGVGLDDRVQKGVQASDAVEVCLGQLDAAQRARRHQPLEFRDRGLEPRGGLVGVPPWRHSLVDRPMVAAGDRRPGQRLTRVD